MTAFDKNNPFKTPEGYFENFSESLDDALRLEKLSAPKATGHTVPEDYFEGIPEQILSRVARKTPKLVSLNRRFYYAVAGIAAATIITLITLGVAKNQDQGDSLDNDIALEVIEEYMLEDGAFLFDFDVTTELVIATDLPFDMEFLATQEIETFLETEIDNINLEDYEID